MKTSECSDDTDLLVQNKETQIHDKETAWSWRQTWDYGLLIRWFMKVIRFISAEVIVFSFVFVFYYYLYFTQQYFFQWYAIEALRENTTHVLPNQSTVCYNQTLITKLSGSNSTIDEVEGKAAHMNLMLTLAMYIPSLIINLIVSPLSDKYGRKPVVILVLTGEALAIVLSVTVTYLELDVHWFLLCGFILGFSGGVSTLM